MGRKKLSMSEKVRRYIAAHPNAKPREVAAALGVKPALVYAVKYKQPKKTNKVSSPKSVPLSPEWKLVAAVTTNQPIEQEQPAPKADEVNHPPHYTAGGIETIDFIQAKLTREEFIGYLKGNAIKYGSRLGKKGDAHIDAGKMAWYSMKLRDLYAV